MLRPLLRSVSHEDLFVERYASFRELARRLTGQPHEADDLVHDAFVRFTLVRPDLAGIENLDGYFYALLRNVHLTRTRRAVRRAETSLSIIDYDSAESGLRAIDPRDWLQARDALRAACRYGCARKGSSKTGSVFLFRYFHGYVPTEIAKIMRSTIRLVDEWSRLARKEANLYLTDPGRLTFLRTHDEGVNEPAVPASDSARELLHELRNLIFQSRHRRCYSQDALEAIYRDEAASGTVDATMLAELVSCPRCLARIDTLLGLTNSVDRFPSDTLGRNARPSLSLRRSTAVSGGETRRLREAFEHRPLELRVAVNGYVVGIQPVQGARNELTLNVNAAEAIGVVEVLSEQDVCLLFLNVVSPPDGPATQTARATLSEDRYVEVQLTFSGHWPRLHAVYIDPLREATYESIPECEAQLTREPAMIDPEASVRNAWLRRLWPVTLAGRLMFGTVLLLLAILIAGGPASAMEGIGDSLRWLADRLHEWTAPRPLPRSEFAPVLVPFLPTFSPSFPPSGPSASSVATPTTVNPLDAARLEIRVLRQLQQVDAYLGQEIHVTTSAAGELRVDGVVDTGARREELLRALATLGASSRLVTRIRSMSEVTSRGAPRAGREVRAWDVTILDDQFPAYATLSAHFRTRRADAAAAARVFAADSLARTQRTAPHAWALKHVTARIDGALIDRLDAASADAWRSLLRTHAQALGRGLRELGQHLEPVFAPAVPVVSGVDAPSNVSGTVARIATEWSEFESEMLLAFAASSDPVAKNAAGTPEFWNRLSRLDVLTLHLRALVDGQ